MFVVYLAWFACINDKLLPQLEVHGVVKLATRLLDMYDITADGDRLLQVALRHRANQTLRHPCLTQILIHILPFSYTYCPSHTHTALLIHILPFSYTYCPNKI